MMGVMDEVLVLLVWFLSGENRVSGVMKLMDVGWTRSALSVAYDGWEGSVVFIWKMCVECGFFDGIVGFS